MQNSLHGITIEDCLDEFIYTPDDRIFIDFTSGIFSANIGHSNPFVKAAISRQMTTCTHSYQFRTEIRDRYIAALCDFTGYESAVLFCSGKAEINGVLK